MNKLTPLTEIMDFTDAAQDLSILLKRSDNTDIADEFPPTVSRYGGTASEAIVHMKEARDLCEVGSREQFIVYAGERAVGMCIITNQIAIPDGINPNAPNVSGFISNPFRGRGLGRFSIEERMKIVEKNFNNRAWTFVKDSNLTSEHLVISAGFQKSEREVEGWEGHHLYLFGDTVS